MSEKYTLNQANKFAGALDAWDSYSSAFSDKMHLLSQWFNDDKHDDIDEPKEHRLLPPPIFPSYEWEQKKNVHQNTYVWLMFVRQILLNVF